MRKIYRSALWISVLFTVLFIIIGKTNMVKAEEYVHYNDVLIGTHNLNNTVTNSAKIGDTLTEPELGWNRYDDSNSKIDSSTVLYHTKVQEGNPIGFYKNTFTMGFNYKAGCGIKFSIYGQKVRILGRCSKYDKIDRNTLDLICDGINVEQSTLTYRKCDPSKSQGVLLEYSFDTYGKHEIELLPDSDVLNDLNNLKGAHGSLVLDAIDTDGQLIDANDNTNSQKLDPIINVESPQTSKTYTDNFNLSGYALNQSGVKSVKVYLDGNYSRDAQIGIQRTDVGAKYQQYLGANNSGFSTTYNVNDFTIGNHTMKVEAIGNDGTIKDVTLYLYVYNSTIIVQTTKLTGPAIEYQAHVKNVGWQNWVDSGNVAGTTGQSLQMEAIKIRFKSPYNTDSNLHIEYRAHVANIGWMPWVRDGEIAGTTGQNIQMEALQVRIVDNNGNIRNDYTLSYQAHIQNTGWQNPVYTEQTAGTTGQSLRMEAAIINVSQK